jgi:DNA-directed RNA polymerase specialized sigma24 family protein
VCVGFDEQLHSDVEPFVGQDARLDYQRAANATRRWFEEQAPDVRSYVARRFIDGTSQRDMEKAAGVSRRTARTRDAQALDALKAYLDAQGIAWRSLFK